MGGSPQVPPLPLHSSLFCLCVLLWWLTPPAPTALSGAEVPHDGSVRAAGARRPPLGPAAPTTAPRPPSLWRERPPSRAPAPSATSQSASGTSSAYLPAAIAGASLLGVLLWALPTFSRPQQRWVMTSYNAMGLSPAAAMDPDVFLRIASAMLAPAATPAQRHHVLRHTVSLVYAALPAQQALAAALADRCARAVEEAVEGTAASTLPFAALVACVDLLRAAGADCAAPLAAVLDRACLPALRTCPADVAAAAFPILAQARADPVLGARVGVAVADCLAGAAVGGPAHRNGLRAAHHLLAEPGRAVAAGGLADAAFGAALRWLMASPEEASAGSDTRTTDRERSFLLAALLPLLLRTEGLLPHCDSRRQLWATIHALHDAPSAALQQQAFTTLALFLADFFPPAEGGLDLRAEPAFWEMLQRGLRSRDVFLQKQCVAVLRRLISQFPGPDRHVFCTYFGGAPVPVLQQQWRLFCTIYETADSFGLHLIRPVWRDIEKLVPRCDGRQPTLHVSWLRLLFHRALEHRNAGVQRLALQTFLGTDFARHAPWMDAAAVCEVFGYASRSWLFRHREPAAQATYEEGTKGKGGLAHSEEEFEEWNHAFLFQLRDFFTRYCAALPACEDRRALVAALLRFGAGQQLHSVAMALLFHVLLACRRQPDDGPLLDAEGLTTLAQLLEQRVAGQFPVFLEVRIQAATVILLRELMGPPSLWLPPAAEPSPLPRVLHCLALVGRGTSVSHNSDTAGLAGHTGSALALHRLKLYHEKIHGWLATDPAAAGALAAHAEQWAAELRATEGLSDEVDVEAELQRIHEGALLLLCLPPEVSRSLLQATAASLEGAAYRPYLPRAAKARALLLASELLALCGAGAAADPLCAATLAAYGPRLADLRALVDAEFVFDNGCGGASPGSPMACPVADVLIGAVYVAVRTSAGSLADHRADTLSWLRRLVVRAEDYLQLYANSLSVSGPRSSAVSYAAVVAARNALRLFFVVSLLAVEGHVAWQDLLPAENWANVIRLFLNLEAPPLSAADCPTGLAGGPWAAVLDQFHRYRWCVVAAALHPLGPGPAVRPLAAEVYAAARAALDSATDFNVGALWDVLRVAVPNTDCMGDPEELERLLAVARVSLAALQRRPAVRGHGSAASLLCALLPALPPAGQARVAAFLLEALRAAAPVSTRVVWVIAVPCLVALRSELAAAAETPMCEALWDVLFYLMIDYNQSSPLRSTEDDLRTATLCLQEAEAEFALAAMFPTAVDLAALVRVGALAALWTAVRRHHAATGRAHPALRLLVPRLLEANRLPELNVYPVMPNSVPHRARLRLWQGLCAVVDFIDADLAAQVQPELRAVFAIATMGSVRRLMELFVIRLAQRHPAYQAVVVEELGNTDCMAQLYCSLVSVAGHLLLTARAGDTVEPALLPPIVAALTSHNYRIRLYAQLMLRRISLAWAGPADCPVRAVLAHPMVRALVDYIDGNAECTKWRLKHEDYVVYDLARALSLRDLFSQRQKEGEQWVEDYIPPAVMADRLPNVVQEFDALNLSLNGYDFWRTSIIVPAVAADVFRPMADGREGTAVAPRPAAGDPAEAEVAGAAGDRNYQQKLLAAWAAAEADAVVPRAEAEARRRTPLRVVASFIENPINLAALCRCSEVFLADCLLIPTKRVLTKPEFTGTSVSSELWVPIEELPPADVPGWLRRQREEGWRLVGVEQTARSVKLPEYPFEGRPTVLVMGAEKEGIPVDILQLLDDCVEIPQFGVIRSLNVHVSAAIVMYEFTRQAATLAGDTT